MRTRAAVTALALSILVVTAATAGPPLGRGHGLATAQERWLTGQLLVATEELRDPRFHRTVIYLVRHDRDGAMGLVVNRPIGPLPSADVLRAAGMDASGVTGELPVHAGGPVEPARGFVLHSAQGAAPGSRVVGSGIAVTVDPPMLGAIARGTGPRRWLLLFGYAGWAPGQLEGEIDAGAWITVDADAALLFDTDPAQQWERATARQPIRL